MRVEWNKYSNVEQMWEKEKEAMECGSVRGRGKEPYDCVVK